MDWDPGEREHGALFKTAVLLVDALKNLEERLQHRDEVEHAFNTHNAVRCRSLGFYLESALSSLKSDAYAPSFAALRSSLEHVFVDKLVFLGQRYVQIFSNIDEEAWAKWQEERESGAGWSNVHSWHRSKRGNVKVVYEGMHSEPNDQGVRQTIGVHYFLLNEYSPFVAPPREQEYFDDGITDVDSRRNHAENNKSLYDTYLKWSSIKESLKENGFFDEEGLRRLDVHYRFLSAFNHPNTSVERLLYGNRSQGWPKYDHYSSELILLYVSVLAVEELKNFISMASNHPQVDIADLHEVEDVCNYSWSLSSHLWFPGQRPHGYDRYYEANRRAFREIRGKTFSNAIDPASLEDAEISYYSNPLDRLIKMHSHSHEMMTGIPYLSPWHRLDARYR